MREIHVAGPLVDNVQRCARCGEILTDYRGAMVPEGTPALQGWQVGVHVETDGTNPRAFWITTDAPTCEELEGDSVESHGLL